jgi:hypothetical protein
MSSNSSKSTMTLDPSCDCIIPTSPSTTTLEPITQLPNGHPPILLAKEDTNPPLTLSGEDSPLSKENQEELGVDTSLAEPSSQLAPGSPSNESSTSIVALSDEEEDELFHLEKKIQKAFWEAGNALKKIRDKRLYKGSHRRFEDYCKERWGFSDRYARNKIAGSEVYENLKKRNNCSTFSNGAISEKVEQSVTVASRWRGNLQDDYLTFSEVAIAGAAPTILPVSEAQVRHLTCLTPEEQVDVWQAAIAKSEGKAPTERIVKLVMNERRTKEPPLEAADFKVGDAFILRKLEGRDFKSNGTWAIATEVRSHSIIVDSIFGNFHLRVENLELIPDPKAKAILAIVLGRVNGIIQQFKGKEISAMAFLESLAKKTYFTEIDLKLLDCLQKGVAGCQQ